MSDFRQNSEEPVIELVYFDGCPHAAQARANLKAVLASAGRPEVWQEWVQGETAPSWVERLPSPTVLVRGRNVAGDVPETEGPACAPGGAPSAEAIRRALEEPEAGDR